MLPGIVHHHPQTEPRNVKNLAASTFHSRTSDKIKAGRAAVPNTSIFAHFAIGVAQCFFNANK